MLRDYAPLTSDQIEQAKKMIEVDKLQQRKVAEILGVGRGKIERLCKMLELKTQRTGPRSGPGHVKKWKGGRHVTKDGYVYVYMPEHPHAVYGRYILEHRLVMEQNLGRYLDDNEVVHHKNGIRQDNRIENLIVFRTNGEHLKHELKGKCPKWTPEGLERIREGNRRKSIRSQIKSDARQHTQPGNHQQTLFDNTDATPLS